MIEFDAEDRGANRYRTRKAFLRSIDQPDARVTNGRPDRPSSRPEKRRERNRRWYVRKVARENGISVETAEFLTPRRPKNGRRVNVARDARGQFIKSRSRVAPGRK